MTLMISHGAFSGMCNESHGWRCEVARAAGYGIEEQWGGDYIVLDWDAITDDNILGVWKTPATDPLLVLLAHSDTEGTIGPSEALRLADQGPQAPRYARPSGFRARPAFRCAMS